MLAVLLPTIAMIAVARRAAGDQRGQPAGHRIGRPGADVLHEWHHRLHPGQPVPVQGRRAGPGA